MTFSKSALERKDLIFSRVVSGVQSGTVLLWVPENLKRMSAPRLERNMFAVTAQGLKGLGRSQSLFQSEVQKTQVPGFSGTCNGL